VISKILIRKPEGRTPLGRPGRIGEDNINMDYKEMREDWIQLAQDRDQ
jgi:hypothetical protein